MPSQLPKYEEPLQDKRVDKIQELAHQQAGAFNQTSNQILSWTLRKMIREHFHIQHLKLMAQAQRRGHGNFGEKKT